ncbi:MAG: glycosyltransferase family 2 protein [Verrucomicrobiota bacterium]
MPALPLVSIIIPCFNGERWLKQAVESAVNQQGITCEVFIVDDCSTDNSSTLAKSLASKNVQVIQQPNNQGASAARNEGLNRAQGEFIQYLDADDFLSLDKIEAQLKTLSDSDGALLVTCPIIFFKDGSDPKTGQYDASLPHAGDHDDPLDFLLRLYGVDAPGSMIQTSQWLIPRDVASRAGPWDTALTLDDDGEYFARIVLASQGVRYSPEGRVYYRKHEQQNSLSGSWRHKHSFMASGLLAMDKKLKHLKAHSPGDSRIDRALTQSYLEWGLTAYPRYPDLSKRALSTAEKLNKAPLRPKLSTHKAQTLQRFLGWRLARRLQYWYSNV